MKHSEYYIKVLSTKWSYCLYIRKFYTLLFLTKTFFDDTILTTKCPISRPLPSPKHKTYVSFSDILKN